MNIIYHHSLPSTNRYCELLNVSELEEFTVIAAHAQPAGIGQAGHTWESQPGANLTFSLLLKPTCIDVRDQYMLTKVVSLGVTDWLRPQLPRGVQVFIKWPNDIYIESSKVAGMLISHRTAQQGILSTIVGIGLNLNQLHFSKWIPNAISLRQCTGQRYVPVACLPALVGAIRERYRQLCSRQQSAWQALDAEYLQQLWRYRQWGEYIHEGTPVRAMITGVNRWGHLQLTTQERAAISCQMKEIQFVLPPQGAKGTPAPGRDGQ